MVASVTLPPLPPIDESPCYDGITNPPPPLLPPGVLPGIGNLLYYSTLKGLAICNQAYGSDGTDGAPHWVSGNGTAPTNLVGDGLKIRSFDLDPWSLDPGTKSFLTAGWAMTDAGLWRVTGLPTNPVWTQKLTLDQAKALLPGLTPDSLVLSRLFTTSELRSGFIATTVWGNITLRQRSYLIWSFNFGEIWQADENYFNATVQDPQLLVSQHTDGDIFLVGGDGFYMEDQDYPSGIPAPSPFMWRATLDTLPHFSAFRSFVPGEGDGGTRMAHLTLPYSDSNGVPYTDDSRAYVSNTGWYTTPKTVLKIQELWIPLWGPGYTPSTQEGIASPDMTWGFSSGNPYNLFIHPHNENRMLVCRAGSTSYFVTEDGAETWTKYADKLMGGYLSYLHQAYMIPSKQNTFFVAGTRPAEGGIAAVGFTKDYGVTLTDISEYGTSGDINTIMDLEVGDCANSQVIVDRAFVGNPTESADMLDVSHYQGTMNWATALAGGITHTFIKASQGASYTDPQFATNWAGALAQGIKRGAYHYFENGTDPTTQANHFMAVMGGDYGELGPAVDCEDEATLDPANLKTFLDRVETLSGMKCTIYTRASWWNSKVGSQGWTSSYPLWVAHWNVPVPTLPTGWTEYSYWQFSSLGPGAFYGAQSGFIDLNRTANWVE